MEWHLYHKLSKSHLTSPEILEEIYNNIEYEDEGFKNNIAELLSANRSSNSELLDKLSYSDLEEVRINVARHYNTSLSTLTRLSEDYSINVRGALINSYRYELLIDLLQNDSKIIRLMALSAINKDGVDYYWSKNKENITIDLVIKILSLNDIPKIDPEAYKYICEIKKSLAESKNTHNNILVKLSQDTSTDIQQLAKQTLSELHSNCPDKQLCASCLEL